MTQGPVWWGGGAPAQRPSLPARPLWSSMMVRVLGCQHGHLSGFPELREGEFLQGCREPTGLMAVLENQAQERGGSRGRPGCPAGTSASTSTLIRMNSKLHIALGCSGSRSSQTTGSQSLALSGCSRRRYPTPYKRHRVASQPLEVTAPLLGGLK